MSLIRILKERLEAREQRFRAVEVFKVRSGSRKKLLKGACDDFARYREAVRGMFFAALPHMKDRGFTSSDTTIIVLASNYGLCGKFNRNISEKFRKSDDMLRNVKSVIRVGRRCRISNHKIISTLSFPDMVTEGKGYDPIGEKIAFFEKHLTEILPVKGSKKLPNIVLIGNIIKDNKSQSEAIKLIPADEEQASDNRKPTRAKVGDMELLFPGLYLGPYDGGAENELFEYLIKQYVQTEIVYALLISELTENEERFRTTTETSQRIEEDIKALRLQILKTRQADITRELVDTISGAMAFRKARER